LWRIDLDEQWKCRLNKFIGPPWSWVSIESPLILPTFATMPAEIRLEILDHGIQCVFGSDRYGPLLAVDLKVRGCLKTAVEHFNPENKISEWALAGWQS
jgi:hypothetical protein